MRTQALLTRRMISVAAERGYAATSIDHLLLGTGIARSTFYENFGDKAGCFRVALRQTAGSLAADVLTNFEASDGKPCRLAGAIVAAAAVDPTRARVVFVESLAAGPAAIAVRDGLLDDWEVLLLSCDAAMAVSPRILLGASARLIAVRLVLGRPIDARLGEEIEDWWRSYRADDREGSRFEVAADGTRARTSGLGRPPRVTAPIDPGLGLEASRAQGRRRRILAAVIRYCAKKGFKGMTVADVIGAAGVSRKAFYAEFESKEGALLAAHEAIFQTAMSACAGGFFGAGTWPERAWEGGAALLRFIDANPEASRVGFLEGPAISHASARIVYERAGAFVVFLAEGFRAYPQAESLPAVTSEALMATVFEWAAARLRGSPEPRLLTAHPELAAAILIPFLGSDAAGSAIEEMLSARSSD